MKNSSTSFRLSYTDSADVPPPFSNKIDVKARKTDEGLHCEYSFVYTERDGLTAEDLAEEGFSENDDRSGNALLPPVWTEVLEQFVAGCSPTKTFGTSGFYVQAGDEKRTFNPEKGAYFLHEIIQAVNEQSRTEKELIVRVADISKQTQIFADFTLSFADRSFSAKISKDGEEKMLRFTWEQTADFVRAAFDFEYVPELGREALPRKRGFYISPDNGFWYQAGKAVFALNEPESESPYFKELCFKLLNIK